MSTEHPPVMRLVAARSDATKGVAAVDTFESATAEVLAQRYPGTERATLWTLVALCAVILVFICAVKLDRVVTARGRLVPVGGTITVQPLEAQVINRITVGVGDTVKKGQVLAYCDPIRAEADQERSADQVASLDAQVRRLEAEESGRPFAPVAGARYDELQARLFDRRKVDLSSSLADFDQRISATESQIAGLVKNIAALDSRQHLGSQMEDMNTRMSQEGYVSKMQLLGVQDQQIALKSQLSDGRASLTSNEHTLASLREQRKGFLDRWNGTVLSDLLTARASLEASRQDLTKATRQRELVNVVAPVDGVVTRVPQLSVGGVAGGAQPLFGLVPLNTPLQAAVQISPQDIGFVKSGDKVNLKLDAYKFLEHGMMHGVVSVFSHDAFSDTSGTFGSGTGTGQDRAAAQFDARVDIVGNDLRNLRAGTTELLPGMTLQADIIVGHRTILWYLLGGALRSGAESMREP